MPIHRRISLMPILTLEIQKDLILSMTYVVQETLRQVASYTLQFAEGSGSDDQRTQLQVVQNTGINFRTVAPLDYDARHLMNLVLDYSFC